MTGQRDLFPAVTLQFVLMRNILASVRTFALPLVSPAGRSGRGLEVVDAVFVAAFFLSADFRSTLLSTGTGIVVIRT